MILVQNSSLFTLLKDLGRYYPIGFPELRESYPGYEELKQTVGLKLAGIRRKRPSSWQQLIRTLDVSFPGYALQDFSLLPEPSLKLCIRVSEQVDYTIHRKADMNLFLSLLVPCYAVFVCDRFFSVGKDAVLGDRAAPGSRPVCVFQRERLTRDERLLAGRLHDAIRLIYPEYGHLSFQELNRHWLSGAVPYGRPETDSRPGGYPVSEFLFGVTQWL